MASPIDPSLPPSNHIEIAVETTVDGLDVWHGFPRAVSGRLLGVHDGVVHSVHLDAGRVRSYRSRRVRSEARDRPCDERHLRLRWLDPRVRPRFARLRTELGPRHRCAGSISPASPAPGLRVPSVDPITGDLHLLAVDPDGRQAHVVVSSGALRGAAGPILDAPNESPTSRSPAITSCSSPTASSASHRMTTRPASPGSRPVSTAPVPVHAHDVAGTHRHARRHAHRSSDGRCTPASATIHREVLDPTPQRFARSSRPPERCAPRSLWATGTERPTTNTISPPDAASSTASAPPTGRSRVRRRPDPTGRRRRRLARRVRARLRRRAKPTWSSSTPPTSPAPPSPRSASRDASLGLHTTWISRDHQQ